MYVGIPNPNAAIPLAKMDITNLDEKNPINKTFTVLYNPQSYKQSRNVIFSQKSPIGSDAPMVQFLNGSGETLEFDLFFDSLYAGAEVGGIANKLAFGVNSLLPSIGNAIDIRDYTKKVYNLTKINTSVHRPPRVKVKWSSLQFTGYLEQCEQNFTKFNELGNPVRATLHCVFVEDVDMDKLFGSNPLESPDTTKFHRIQEGDSLWSLSIEEYGQSGEWRAIADANGIANPRRLRTGDMLRIPALKN